MKTRTANVPATSRGFSMIEVLVALLVIAVGVLGAVALQSRAVQASVESYQRTQALMLVEDMVTRMRNNKANVSTCYARVGETSPGWVGTGARTPPITCGESRAEADLLAWHEMLLGAAELSDETDGALQVGGIMNARGCITSLDDDGQYRISVAWQGVTELAGRLGRDACGRSPDNYFNENLRRVVGVTIRITDLR